MCQGPDRLVSGPAKMAPDRTKLNFPNTTGQYAISSETVEYKVRLVTLGFMQVAGIDYTDTFAPVTWMEGICAILHIGMQCDWLLHQFNVKTTFLYGGLEEEIYMRQLKGYEQMLQGGCAVLLISEFGAKLQAKGFWMSASVHVVTSSSSYSNSLEVKTGSLEVRRFPGIGFSLCAVPTFSHVQGISYRGYESSFWNAPERSSVPEQFRVWVRRGEKWRVRVHIVWKCVR